MHHQVIDVRCGNGVRQFVDQAGEDEHNRKMEEFRASIPKHVKYVVSPGHRVRTCDGRWLDAGAPITADDVPPDAGFPEQGRAGWSVFEAMLVRLEVTENYSFDPKLVSD